MKLSRFILGVALAASSLAVTAGSAQAASDLLITQYYEGASNDHWIEVTNVSPAKIDLANYRLGVWRDANAEGYKTNAAPDSSVAFTGLLAPGASYLYRHVSATQPSGLTANLSGNTGSPADFTGNDSLALFTGGATFSTANLADAIGFTNAGAEGADKSFMRSSSLAGWSTAAGSKVTDFPSVWAPLTLAQVNSAAASTQERLGFSVPALPPSIPGTWQLSFQDEFAGTNLDKDKWRLEGLSGQAASRPENISLVNGILQFKAEQRAAVQGDTVRNFAAGQISTFYKYRQTYGYFEARTKAPAVNGLWPAFWTMPERGVYGNIHATNEAYLKFDLTAAGIGSVSSAFLKLNSEVSDASTAASPNNFGIFKLRDDTWTELGIKWANKPVFEPLWIDQKFNVTLAPGQEVSIDVKDYVAAELAGDKKISFVIADTLTREKLLKFHSKESTTAAYRPRLVINGVTYVVNEDSQVQWGNGTNVNFGTSPTLMVREAWGNTETTTNGGMEMDIQEYLGIWGTDKNSIALHWDGYGATHQATGSGIQTHPASSDGYHVYGMNWQPGVLEFFTDGVKTWEWVNARVCSVASRIILSLQMGGWDGNTPGPQVNNQLYQVDWVRSWTGTPATPGTPTEVIVDNANTAATRTLGVWAGSVTITGYYGSNYTSDGNAQKGNRNFRFKPALTEGGDYQVYAWWVAATNRASNVPIDIVTGSGSITTVTVDQTINGSRWVLLGTFPLAPNNAEVIIRTDGTNNFVIADAVKFTPVP